MRFATRLVCLRIALAAFGLILIVAVGPLMLWLWPSGWAWGAGHSHYPPMIVSLYAVLGVFLLLAARQPRAYAAIVWFTVWSSVAHGGVMAVQAWMDPAERGHFVGDIPALFVMAVVLGVLMPREAAFVRNA